MFKAIGKLLSGRAAAAPCFVPPENKHTEFVPAFRASLRAQGLTEAEASAVLVARTIAGMNYLQRKGYTWEQVLQLPASCWLKRPTDEYGYYDYYNYARPTRDSAKLLVTCGLN